MLEVFWEMHAGQFSLENGRKWTYAIEGVAAQIEFGQIPECLLEMVTHCLVGATFLRFQPLWAPTLLALKMMLKHHPEVGLVSIAQSI